MASQGDPRLASIDHFRIRQCDRWADELFRYASDTPGMNQAIIRLAQQRLDREREDGFPYSPLARAAQSLLTRLWGKETPNSPYELRTVGEFADAIVTLQGTGNLPKQSHYLKVYSGLK